eukprot:scaffold47_cov258-Pinguiococcus_pyrenoidosus.AAC.97
MARRREQSLTTPASAADLLFAVQEPKARLPLPQALDSLRHASGQSYGSANDRSKLPPGSSRILFVGNLPSNMSDRELAHIFRPFPGYESLRLARSGERLIAFVSFESEVSSTIAMWTLQGYRVDLNSLSDTRLRIEYCKPRTRRQPPPREQPIDDDGEDHEYY